MATKKAKAAVKAGTTAKTKKVKEDDVRQAMVAAVNAIEGVLGPVTPESQHSFAVVVFHTGLREDHTFSSGRIRTSLSNQVLLIKHVFRALPKLDAVLAAAMVKRFWAEELGFGSQPMTLPPKPEEPAKKKKRK